MKTIVLLLIIVAAVYSDNIADKYVDSAIALIEFTKSDETKTLDAIDNALRNTVHIDVYYEVNGQLRGASGSGFFISPTEILTNVHVIDRAINNQTAIIDIIVYGDDTIYTATVMGTDIATDIAILKIENGPNLTGLEWGDNRYFRNGATVYSFGSPLKLKHSVLKGIISHTARRHYKYPARISLQISTTSHPGSSGGPAITSDGKLACIVFGYRGTSAKNNPGLTGCVRSDIAQESIQRIRQSGDVIRLHFMSSLMNIDENLRLAYDITDTKGLYAATVELGSLEDSIGMVDGDILLSVNNITFSEAGELHDYVHTLKHGESVSIGILRDGSVYSMEFTIK